MLLGAYWWWWKEVWKIIIIIIIIKNFNIIFNFCKPYSTIWPLFPESNLRVDILSKADGLIIFVVSLRGNSQSSSSSPVSE